MSARLSQYDSESEDEDEVEVKVVWQRTSIPRYIVLFCFFMIGATYGTILYFGLTQPGPENEGSAGQKWRNFIFPNRTHLLWRFVGTGILKKIASLSGINNPTSPVGTFRFNFDRTSCWSCDIEMKGTFYFKNPIQTITTYVHVDNCYTNASLRIPLFCTLTSTKLLKIGFGRTEWKVSFRNAIFLPSLREAFSP